jgi:hypothetical protein
MMTLDELLADHKTTLELALSLLTEKISKERKEEAIGLMREALKAANNLIESRKQIVGFH